VQPLKVGIAGAARGAGFVTGIEAMPAAAVLHAVYDPSEAARAAFAQAHGIEHSVTDYGQLLALCDVVVVSSPQQHHAPQAIAALEAGVHVLSEVPAVVSLEQAADLVAAARRSGAAYAMAENYCYTRSNLVVRAMAREGMFGDLYYGEGEYLHEMKGYHTTPDGSPTWRYHWQVGRDGFTYPTHSLGPLLQWFDDRVVSVSCVGSGRHTDSEHEIQDSIVMLARTRNGALLRTRLDLLSNRPHLMDYYSLQGTEGAFEAARTPGAEPRRPPEGGQPGRQLGAAGQLRRPIPAEAVRRRSRCGRPLGCRPLAHPGLRAQHPCRRAARAGRLSRIGHDIARGDLGTIDRPGWRLDRRAESTLRDRRYRCRPRPRSAVGLIATARLDPGRPTQELMHESSDNDRPDVPDPPAGTGPPSTGGDPGRCELRPASTPRLA